MNRFRIIMLTVLLAIIGLAGAAPASAVDLNPLPDCTSAPTPEVPGRGLVGFFESTAPPRTAHPTLYEKYGYAGLRWNTYDLGCGPDIARAPDAAVGTAVANWIVAIPQAAVAATGAILRVAYKPDFLGAFDPLIDKVVKGLQRGVFERWYLYVMLAIGLWIIWNSRKQQLSDTANAIGWVLLVMVAVTVVFRWPTVAGHATDQAMGDITASIQQGVNDTQSGDAATATVAGLHQSVLYQAWLAGTFGSATSPTAVTFGPKILDATALTWDQAATLQRDPAAGKKIIEDKEAAFKTLADQIKDQDPDAYQYLTGHRSDTRVAYALLTGLAILCAIPFLFVAGLLVIGALMIVRCGVMLLPAFATLGLFPTLRHMVTGLVSACVAALVNAVLFAAGAAVTVLGIGAILSTIDKGWLQIVLMLLLTIIMWGLLKPMRHLTTMTGISFRNGVQQPGLVARGAARLVGKVGGAIVTGGAAGAAAAITSEKIADYTPAEPPARVEAQPTPVIVHPPAPKQIEAPRPPVVVATVTDLPPPAPARVEAAHTPSLEASTPDEPLRIEAMPTDPAAYQLEPR